MATIQGIYLALFGRPADPAGLTYFNGLTNNGANLAGIANLAGQPEYTARFTGMSNTQIINSIYQSLFGRDGETAGVSFWLEKLTSGALTINNIAIAILDGAQGADKTTIDAKLAAAALFTTHLDLPAEQNAYNTTTSALIKTYLAGINTTKAATGTEIDAVIQSMLTSGGQGPDGGENPGGGGGGETPNVLATFQDGEKAEIAANAGEATEHTVTVTDTDGVSVFSTPDGDIAGKYGTFNFVSSGAVGTWEYTLSAAGKAELLPLNDAEKESDSFTVTAADGTTHAISVLINGVNEAPTVDGKISANTQQGDALTDIDMFANVGDVDHGAGFIVTEVKGVAESVGQEVEVTSENGRAGKFTISADGKLAFTPGDGFKTLAEGAEDKVSVTFTVSDGHGGSVANTVDITVAGINDAPTGASKPIAVLEDGSHTFSAVDFGFSDTDGNTFDGIIVTGVSDGGYIKLGDKVVTVDSKISAADIGNLVFAPAANASGDSYATLSFKVYDNGGTANDGVDTAVSASTITFNVTSVNDAPTGGNVSKTIKEDQSHTFQTSDFVFTDANTETDGFAGIKITSTPQAGSLKFDGTLVTVDQVISAEMLDKLVFTPDQNASGSTNFGFKVQDKGGVANGGSDTAVAESSFTINVTALNDAPVGANRTLTASEDTAYTFKAGDFPFSDTADTPANALSAVIIKSLPTLGTLTLTGGGNVVIGQEIAAADIPKLKYTPAADGNGATYSSFTFSVKDGGPSGDGNQNTETGSHTITFNVAAVNDAPKLVSNANPIPNTDGKEGVALSLNVASKFVDVDGDTLHYTATLSNGHALPSWLTLSDNGTFSGKPLGEFKSDIKVTVSDGTLTTTDIFNLDIAGAKTTHAVTPGTVVTINGFEKQANDSQDRIGVSDTNASATLIDQGQKTIDQNEFKTFGSASDAVSNLKSIDDKVGIVSFTFSMGNGADLSKNLLPTDNATELFKALNTSSVDIKDGWVGFIVASDKGNTYIYHAESGGSHLSADEVHLVAVVNDATGLSINNFTVL